MKDDEPFDYLCTKLNDIINSGFILSKKISRTKIVRKVHRYLSKRFRYKITSIKESKDLDVVKIEEKLDPTKPMKVPYLNLRRISL